jgi:hypothetical protein
MTTPDNLDSFLQDNKKIVKDYFNTRTELIRLRFIRFFSNVAGYFSWLLVSVVLVSLLVIFLGMTTGFWLSQLTGSYVKGFGLTSLIILSVILLAVLLRRVLFINPIIRVLIRKTEEGNDNDKRESYETE